MKISELWLREWVNPNVSIEKLAEQLTIAGFEVDSVSSVAPQFKGIVVGEVLNVKQHPGADRLRLCEVNIGQNETLHIVCGAANVRDGLRVPVAVVGAVLPNNFIIKKAKLRGEESYGMLCSASELNLAETSEGLMELPDDAPIGEDIRNYLKLDDYILDIDVTANRGDCLSILGIAREVAAINDCILKKIAISDIQNIKEFPFQFPVSIEKNAENDCPHYVGCIINNININAKTPIWIIEKLRRLGIRSINPVVDVTNYVMLELGQPMHAFDFAKIDSEVRVRKALHNEKITLLNGNEITLNNEELIIADKNKPLALAGIMGSLDSGVSNTTTDIFLESAFFTPDKIFGRARSFGLQTDSSYRFERGVDPKLQSIALRYAVKLLLEIVGGNSSSFIELTNEFHLPLERSIILRAEKIKKYLGLEIHAKKIINIINRLGFSAENMADGWKVTCPSFRFNLAIEEDIIGEIARIYGYNSLPSLPIISKLEFSNKKNFNYTNNKNKLCQFLVDLGYNEVITYSFVDKKLQEILDENTPVVLINPISSEMGVMRTSLWPGLLNAYLYNQNRKKNRVRLFEIGLSFIKKDKNILQEQYLGGIATGSVYPVQWGKCKNDIDFFDVKNDLLSLLLAFGFTNNISFKEESHKTLHPKRSARIYLENKPIGFIGELHPEIKQKLEISTSVVVFEINLFFLSNVIELNSKVISRFPAIERDLAIVVDRAISWQQIKDIVVAADKEILQAVDVFDVYYGQGIDLDKKSVALHLVFRHKSRTLIENEVETSMQKICTMLEQSFDAKLRG